MVETKIFDGRAAAAQIKEELKKEARAKDLRPNLAIVLVGEDPSSLTYIKQKQKACELLGWGFDLHQLPKASTFEEIKSQLLKVNGQRSAHGLILQLPLPTSLQIPSYELTTFILPGKDIDGLTPQSPFTPPTALAVEYVLDCEKIKIESSKAVVLGRGATSGRPVAELLFKRGAKVFVIHSQTDPLDAKRYTLNADIVVSCVGQPNLISGEMIKEGAVVLGVGISKVENGKWKVENGEKKLSTFSSQGGSASGGNSSFDPELRTEGQLSTIQGDLNETSLLGKARLITPTPSGIGPLTVAFLLKNLLEAEIRRGGVSRGNPQPQ